MNAVLILLLGESLERPIRWGLVLGDRALERGILDGAEHLASLADAARRAGSVIALLPGEQVSCRVLAATPRGEKARLAAAGLLLEDELAEPRANLRIAVGEGGGAVIAFAVKASIAAGWIAALKQAGLECDCLSADFLALPRSPGETLLLVDDDRVVCAHGAGGFAVDGQLFAALKERLFAEPPAILRIIGEEARLGEIQGTAVDWLGPVSDERLFETYAASIAAAAAPSFLPRRLFKRRAIAASVGPWRRAAGLAAALAIAALATLIADAARASRESARWTEAARAIHDKAFPEAADADPAEYARRRLAGGGAAPSFLLLSSRLKAAIAEGGGVRVDRIRFDSARGDFSVSLESDSDAEIGALKARLREVGLSSEDVGGFSRREGAWVGEIRIGLR